MIRDIESQLNRVWDDEVREFLEEALKCYGAGAYRGAVVIAFNAAMDDLRRKLQWLVDNRTKDAKFESTVDSIQDSYRQQNTWEECAIDTANGELIDDRTAEQLKRIKEIRHQCAHPSPHSSTPEEARWCITELVDRVMAKPVASGMPQVFSILRRLDSPYFFASGEPDSRTAKRACGNLDEGSCRALMGRLRAEIVDEETSATVWDNSKRLMAALVATRDDCASYFWMEPIFVKLLDEAKDSIKYRALFDIAGEASRGFAAADLGMQVRFNDFVTDYIFEYEEAIDAVKKFQTAGDLEERMTESLIDAFRSRTWRGSGHETKARVEGKVACDLEMDAIDAALAEKVLQSLSRSDYEYHNAAVRALEELGEKVFDHLEDDEVTELLFKICDAAGTLAKLSGYSYGAIRVVKDGLDGYDDVFEILAKKLAADELNADEFENHYRLKNLFLLLYRSNQSAIIHQLLELLQEVTDPPGGITHAFLNFPISGEQALTELVESALEGWGYT